MADMLIRDHGDGGDVVPRAETTWDDSLVPTSDNADLHQDTGIGSAVYLSLFGGTSWCDGLKAKNELVPSAGEFEASLNAPISAGSIADIKRKAEAQLVWLTDQKVVETVEVSVRNPQVGRIEIDISATEPNSAENRYKILWDASAQKLIEMVRNP